MYELVRDTIANVNCEMEIRCASCDEQAGYWAYGYYEPGIRPDEMKRYWSSWRGRIHRYIARLAERINQALEV